jgi:hypothetical protein
MSNYSGLNPLDYYSMWKIADNALVYEAHNIPLSDWVTKYYDEIMYANDKTFEIDFVTDEMGILVAGN